MPNIECANARAQCVSIVPNIVWSHVGYIQHPTSAGQMIAIDASTFRYCLPGMRSISTQIDRHIQLQIYDSNCIFEIFQIYFAGIYHGVKKAEPLNTIDCVETILKATFKVDPLEVYYWRQLTVGLPWSSYWTDAATRGGDMVFNDPVFGPHWTRYAGALYWFLCHTEELCDCTGYNISGTHTTIQHPAAAGTTAKFLGILVIVIVPLTPITSELDPDNWHCQM